MAIRRTPDADADIAAISFYSGEQFGRRAADAYMTGLIRTFEFLEANPKAARARLGFSRAIRIHRYKAHMIAYIAQEDGVLIVRVLHGRQSFRQAGF